MARSTFILSALSQTILRSRLHLLQNCLRRRMVGELPRFAVLHRLLDEVDEVTPSGLDMGMVFGEALSENGEGEKVQGFGLAVASHCQF